jgi:hypothetical protein
MNLKIFFILSMLFVFFSSSSFATCTWDGKPINNSYSEDVNVDIHDMGDSSGYIQLLDFASHLQCQVGDHLGDTTISMDAEVKYYLTKYSGSDAGLLAQFYNSTVNTDLQTVSDSGFVNYDLTGKQGTFVPVIGTLSLKLPASVFIGEGTQIGHFGIKVNDIFLSFHVKLNSSYIKPKDYCQINSGNAINVNFGDVDIMSVPSFISSNKSIKTTVSMNCSNNLSKSLNLYLEGQSTSFLSSKLIATSNKDLGVYLLVGGQVITANDKIPVEIKNGTASEEISVGLVRNPDAKIDDISLGDFNSSSTIVLSEN